MFDGKQDLRKSLIYFQKENAKSRSILSSFPRRSLVASTLLTEFRAEYEISGKDDSPVGSRHLIANHHIWIDPFNDSSGLEERERERIKNEGDDS